MRQRQAATESTSQGFFYGWVVAVACWLVTFVNGGLFWTFGVFFSPLSTEFAWSRSQISLVTTAFLLAYAPGAILCGKVADRFGPRRVLWAASMLVLVGYLGSSHIHSLMPLILFYGLIGLGTSATLGLPIATVQRWFVRRRGLMLGIVASGPGIGSLFFAPLAAGLISGYQWRMAYIILGLALGLVLAIGASLMDHSPERRGVAPFGGHIANASSSPARASNENGLRTGEAIRTNAFWGLAILNVLSLMPTLFFNTHFVPLAMDRGSTAVAAAQAVGMIGAFGVPGRILMGGAADRIGWMKGVAIANFVAAAALLGLSFFYQSWMLYLFVVLYGFFNGGNLALLAGAVSLFFGIASLGELLGFTLAFGVLSGSVSPWLGGLVFDRTGSYFLFLIFAAVFFAAGGVYALVLKPPKAGGKTV